MKLSKEEKIRQQQKVIMEQEHKIDRLCNTIIELEEYINNNKKLLAETLNDGTFTIFNYINADELLDKLNELKGDSSNEN